MEERVAHIYAGILGPLAFLTSLANGAFHARQVDVILLSAWVSLVVFSMLGYAAGWLAARIVEDAVRGRIAAEAAAQSSAPKVTAN